jgi:hypothetical protein
VDKRITEISYLLPQSCFGRGLSVGVHESDAVERLKRMARELECIRLEEIGSCARESFDFVFCLFPRKPHREEIRAALNAAIPGGAVIAVFPSSIFGTSAVKRGMGADSIYGISPSLDDIRLMVPLTNRACAAASLALYQPSRPLARLRRRLAYRLAMLGLSSAWTPWVAVIARKGGGNGIGDLQAVLKELYGDGTVVALFTGTPGHLRKTTLQIMDYAGRILGYCKIADNPYTKAVLENEAATLKLLSAVNLGETLVPLMMFFGDTQSGVTALVQSTRKGHLSAGPTKPGRAHREFLSGLFNVARENCRFKNSSCYCEVSKRLGGLDGFVSMSLLTDLHGALEWSSNTLDDREISLCLAHRDFTPWNTFLVGERLYVFDWEFARKGWIPLADGFHFVLQKGILVDHAEDDALWERIMGDSSVEREFLRACASDMRVHEVLYRPLLSFYLTDVLTTYLTHCKDAGQPPDLDKEPFRPWRSLLLKTKGMGEQGIPG